MPNCKICLAFAQELDESGRCPGCADAIAATNVGLSYGKLIAKIGANRVFVPAAGQEETMKVCLWCGRPLYNPDKRVKYCGYGCYWNSYLAKEREKKRHRERKKEEMGNGE